jgi:hypothetical protein
MTTLEIDRYNALNAYFARPLGNEVEDRSQIVMPELRDTIEWIMPQLMRMFAAGKPCQFDPENPEDDTQAEIETEVVNHVFMKQNPGFFVLHDFFKDALLLRNGYINTYWEKKRTTTVESYTGLTEIEVTELLQTEDEIEILEQDEKPIEIPSMPGMSQMQQQQPQQPGMPPQQPQAPQMQPMMPGMPQPETQSSFDIKLRRTAIVGKCKIECIPPEEMLISPQARHGLDESPFTEHSRSVSRSELIEMGFDQDKVDRIEVAQPDWLALIALARNEVTDQLSEDDPTDPASQLVQLRTAFIRIDYDGDGIAELRRVMLAGEQVLENEEVEEVSYSYCSPMRMPHRHVGISYYDLLMDLQIIKTTLFRQALDNLYVSNNQRMAVDWRNVNMGDLLTSRPGGVIRTTGMPSSCIMPIESPSNLMQQIIPALDYCDLQREMRTGIGKDTMGVDADSLQDVTKGGQLASMSAAAMKVELVARLLGEGVKEVFSKIHRVLMRHQDKTLTLKLTGRWVDIDPADWRDRTQISVNVGLGSGNREEARANVAMIAQLQEKLASSGMVGPKQLFETFKAMSHLLGYENPTQFVMDPDSPEFKQALQQKQQMAQQHPDPHVQVAQIKAQADQQHAQMDLRIAQMETQAQQSLEQTRMRADMAKTQAQQRMEHDRAAIDAMHDAHQHASDQNVQAAQMQSQEYQTLVKVIGQIVASQLKQNATANAGTMINQDMSEVQNGG